MFNYRLVYLNKFLKLFCSLWSVQSCIHREHSSKKYVILLLMIVHSVSSNFQQIPEYSALIPITDAISKAVVVSSHAWYNISTIVMPNVSLWCITTLSLMQYKKRQSDRTFLRLEVRRSRQWTLHIIISFNTLILSLLRTAFLKFIAVIKFVNTCYQRMSINVKHIICIFIGSFLPYINCTCPWLSKRCVQV